MFYDYFVIDGDTKEAVAFVARSVLLYEAFMQFKVRDCDPVLVICHAFGRDGRYHCNSERPGVSIFDSQGNSKYNYERISTPCYFP
jgi:hypothetical protein